MNAMKKSLIMVPYANLEDMQGGVNIATKGRMEVYLKNCSVALLSAKAANPDCDVALVTNIQVPDPYAALLADAGILIIQAPFDSFRFSSDYRWGLAFYKLCALKYAAENLDYDYYAYLDSDVFVQDSFQTIWRECDSHVLLYDICHGLQVPDYRNVLSDLQTFLKTGNAITHYGGEFFAANRKNAQYFAAEAYGIFTQMLEEKFYTAAGDEFILSAVAFQNPALVRNAGAYIFRYWTDSFHLVCTNYQFNPVTILHVPDEKPRGMLKLYRYYTRHHHLPPQSKVWRILSISRQSLPRLLLIFAKNIAKKLLKR